MIFSFLVSSLSVAQFEFSSEILIANDEKKRKRAYLKGINTRPELVDSLNFNKTVSKNQNLKRKTNLGLL